MAEEEINLRPEVEKLSMKLESDPKSRVFAQLADAYRKSNMVDEAIEIAKKGLEIHPNYAAAHLVLGRCFLEKQIYSLAGEELERAVKLDPSNFVALKLLADALFAQGAQGEAIRRYQQVLEINPLNSEVAEKLAELLPPQAAQEPERSAPESTLADKPSSGITLAREQLSDTIEKFFAEKGKEAQASPPASPEPVLESKVFVPEDVYEPASGQAVAEPPLSPEGASEVSENLVSEKGPEAPALNPPVEETSLLEVVPEPVAVKAIEISPEPLPSPPEPEGAPLTGEDTAGIVAEIIADRNLGVPAIPPPEPPAMIESKPPEVAPLVKVEEVPVPATTKGVGATVTLAELYEQQRFYDKALELYEQVLAENPENQVLLDKVRELREKTEQEEIGKREDVSEVPSAEEPTESKGYPFGEKREELMEVSSAEAPKYVAEVPEKESGPSQPEEPETVPKVEEQAQPVVPEEGKPKGEIKSFQEWLDSLIKSKPDS